MSTTDQTLIRQASLPLTLPQSIDIIGVGGVGSWLAYFLALAGVSHLNLWDSDEVSETNLNRLPFGPEFLQVNKANAMRLFLQTIKPSCSVLDISQNWTPKLQSTSSTPEWIVATTDTWASRRSVFEWSQVCTICEKEAGVAPTRCNNSETGHNSPRAQYLEASAEGEFGGCTGAPADFTTPLESHPGYQSVPVWVGPCVGAAMMACAHILHASNLGRANLRLGWQDGTIVLQHS